MTETSHNGPGSISVVGLGKLGLTTAACIASAGFDVIGVDVNNSTVTLVNRGQSPFEEPGLKELMNSSGGRLRAQVDYVSAIQETDLTLIVVPTPSEASGAFSTEYVEAAGRNIGNGLATKDGYHVISLVSTVLPGGTMGALVPAIESTSGKRYGVDFGICYSPEFVALGSVVRDFLNPDFVLIGEGDKRSGDLVESMYRQVCHNSPRIKRISIVEAEIAKLAVNTFVTTKITFANMLGQICDGLPGTNVDSVTEAIGMDSRIGPKYLKAGTGYGGPCFPRDNRALEFLAKSVGASSDIPRATDSSNHSLERYLVDAIERHCSNSGSVAVLGLSYKPGTRVVEESQPVQIALALAMNGHKVSVYDPLVAGPVKDLPADAVEYSRTMAECVKDADVVFIATPDGEFKNLRASDLSSVKPVTIYDAWRIVDPGLGDVRGITHIRFGFGEPENTSLDSIQLQNSTSV